MKSSALVPPRGLRAARPNPRDATLEVAALRLLGARRLLPAAGPLLVGVSGGPDSMALLHFLLAHRASCGEPAGGIVAAHVHHGLRGADADADAAFVRATCAAWGVRALEVSVDAGARPSGRGTSREQASRALRYGALRELAAREGAARVAVAHTADDQAETILFRLVRGSGLRGLAGMRPRGRVHGVTVVRPLLEATRAQVLDYLARHAVPHRLDATNDETTASRNYLRHEILPRLRERLNPAVREALLRGAALFAEADAYLESRARRAFPRVLRGRSGGPGEIAPGDPGAAPAAEKIVLDAARLRAYPKLLRKYLLRCALRDLDAAALDHSAAHIDALLSLLDSPSGKSAGLPNGLRARRERGDLLEIVRLREPGGSESPSNVGDRPRRGR
jgi:tRNA(Ile)-lysidine synthetase-like protein